MSDRPALTDAVDQTSRDDGDPIVQAGEVETVS